MTTHNEDVREALKIQREAKGDIKRAKQADERLREDIKRNHYAEMIFTALGVGRK